EAHYLCGKALLKLERFAEARTELLLAVQLNAKDARPHFLLGQVYDKLGASQEASEARRTFAKLSPRRADEAQGMENLRPQEEKLLTVVNDHILMRRCRSTREHHGIRNVAVFVHRVGANQREMSDVSIDLRGSGSR